jgi:hypothetical protein
MSREEIFGPKRIAVSGKLRVLQNYGQRYVYCDIYIRCWPSAANQTAKEQPLLGNGFANAQQYRTHRYKYRDLAIGSLKLETLKYSHLS